jgi:fructose-bisphosphate aldolase class II
MTLNSTDLINNANKAGLVVPAFNIPYLPMMEPVIQALVDEDAFGLIETARLEWYKFEAQSPAAIAEEFAKWGKPEFVRLHLDHVPVIDEDGEKVNYLPIIKEAIDLGYQSVMIDG